MNTVITTGDNFDTEGGAFILKQPDSSKETSRVHTTRVRVRERVYHPLSPSFSNVGLDDNEDIRVVPTVELIGMGTKHLISGALTVPGDHLHGCGKGGQGLIWNFPCQGNPRCRQRETLIPRCGGHDVIQCFYIAEPGPVRARHDEW